MPFMTKEFSKKMLAKSRLQINNLTDNLDENHFLYTQQRNKCVALLRNANLNYYESVDENNVTDKSF